LGTGDTGGFPGGFWGNQDQWHKVHNLGGVGFSKGLKVRVGGEKTHPWVVKHIQKKSHTKEKPSCPPGPGEVSPTTNGQEHQPNFRNPTKRDRLGGWTEGGEKLVREPMQL